MDPHRARPGRLATTLAVGIALAVSVLLASQAMADGGAARAPERTYDKPSMPPPGLAR